jgi:hypothetical protein
MLDSAEDNVLVGKVELAVASSVNTADAPGTSEQDERKEISDSDDDKTKEISDSSDDDITKENSYSDDDVPERKEISDSDDDITKENSYSDDDVPETKEISDSDDDVEETKETSDDDVEETKDALENRRPSQRNMTGETNQKRSKSTPPSPTRSESLVEASATPMPMPLAELGTMSDDEEHMELTFDDCSISEKALRLGLLIAQGEYEDDTEAEARLTGILQAYRDNLEKQVEQKVLAALLESTPGQMAGARHAVHERRLEIFMLTFRTTFHQAWVCRCENVCQGGRFYCMDSTKQLEFYRNHHNGHKPAQANAQVCYSCYDGLMVKGGEAPRLELSKMETRNSGSCSLLTGRTAYETGCHSCLFDMTDTVGQQELSVANKKSKGMKELVPPSVTPGEIREGLPMNRDDDPFAQREGKTLVWKDVSMTLVSSII